MKKIMSVFIFMSCLLGLGECKKDMNDIIDDEPCVRGVVSETSDAYIVIEVNKDDDLYEDYSRILVSLEVENEKNMTDITIGDEVAVYYNGTIEQSLPPQINHVYAILELYEDE